MITLIVDIQRAIVGVGNRETLGERILNTGDVQKLNSGLQDQIRIPLTNLEIKTAITGTGAQNDPLNMTLRPAIAEGARRRLFMRDLLRQGETSEAAVEFPRETAFTSNAAVQDRENTAFSESAHTLTLSFEPCQTMGFYETTSKQILEDSPALDVYLRDTLLYGLRLKEEQQILYGTASNSELNGLITQATAYAVTSPQLTNEIDIIADILEQLMVAGFDPAAIVMNPVDWRSIITRKTGSSIDEYAVGDPLAMTTPTIWGVPVVITNSITAGTILIGDFARGAVLFDRQQAFVEVSRHHDSNFLKGAITLLVTVREALVVTNAAGLVTATI